MIYDCPFEADALAAAVQSRWPDRVDADLRAHVNACAVCSDVVAVAEAFDAARERTRAEADPPSSARVWRIAQLRARREAAAKAGAPLAVAHMLGFGCAFGLAGACFGATSTWFQGALAQFAAVVSGENGRALLALAVEHGFVLGGAALVVVLVPAAVWLTSAGD